MTGSGTATPRCVLVPWGRPSWVVWGWQSCGCAPQGDAVPTSGASPGRNKKGGGTACQGRVRRAGCGQSVCDPPHGAGLWGEREKAPGTAQPAEMGNEQLALVPSSVLHWRAGGCQEPERGQPRSHQGPWGHGAAAHGKGVPRPGRDPTLTTRASGDSPALGWSGMTPRLPAVSWRKDGVPLRSSTARPIKAEGERHTLLVRSARVADAGLYTVTAANEVGATCCSAILSVRPGECRRPARRQRGTVGGPARRQAGWLPARPLLSLGRNRLPYPTRLGLNQSS